jgi:hypothetical protein
VKTAELLDRNVGLELSVLLFVDGFDAEREVDHHRVDFGLFFRSFLGFFGQSDKAEKETKAQHDGCNIEPCSQKVHPQSKC